MINPDGFIILLKIKDGKSSEGWYILKTKSDDFSDYHIGDYLEGNVIIYRTKDIAEQVIIDHKKSWEDMLSLMFKRRITLYTKIDPVIYMGE